MHYYQRDLAFIHDRGYGAYADHCAPGIIELLVPVRDGLVLELGCGSGALTRHLLAAGLRVVATDASPEMLSLARDALGASADLRQLTLPGDALPAADAVVSTGHVLSYLPDAAAVETALAAAADALRPGGVLAVDILDLDYAGLRAGERPLARVEDDWVIITEFSSPAPDRFVREATTFVPDGAGAWRRGHERHENVLVDTSLLPALLAAHGVRAEVGTAFGAADLPPGLRSVTGRKDLYRTGPGACAGNFHRQATWRMSQTSLEVPATTTGSSQAKRSWKIRAMRKLQCPVGHLMFRIARNFRVIPGAAGWLGVYGLRRCWPRLRRRRGDDFRGRATSAGHGCDESRGDVLHAAAGLGRDRDAARGGRDDGAGDGRA